MTVIKHEGSPKAGRPTRRLRGSDSPMASPRALALRQLPQLLKPSSLKSSSGDLLNELLTYFPPPCLFPISFPPTRKSRHAGVTVWVLRQPSCAGSWSHRFLSREVMHPSPTVQGEQREPPCPWVIRATPWRRSSYTRQVKLLPPVSVPTPPPPIQPPHFPLQQDNQSP